MLQLENSLQDTPIWSVPRQPDSLRNIADFAFKSDWAARIQRKIANHGCEQGFFAHSV